VLINREALGRRTIHSRDYMLTASFPQGVVVARVGEIIGLAINTTLVIMREYANREASHRDRFAFPIVVMAL
jgi:hypothetical protein